MKVCNLIRYDSLGEYISNNKLYFKYVIMYCFVIFKGKKLRFCNFFFRLYFIFFYVF